MSERPYVLAEAHWKTVKKTPYTVAVLPWGATEAHNYHLPFGTDIFESELIAIEGARLAWEHGARPVVLPCVPFGVNTGQSDIKLILNMNPRTQAAILRDIIDTLQRHRIRKLVILNGHGGNDFKQMIREISLEVPSVFVCQINWWQIVKQGDIFEERDDHAGEMETSVMMNLKPDLVLPLSEAGSGKAKRFALAGLREGWVWAQRQWTKVTADTGVGDPRKATREKGERYLKLVTTKIGEFLVELSRANPNKLYS